MRRVGSVHAGLAALLAFATIIAPFGVTTPIRAQSEATIIGYTQMAQLLVVYSLGSG